MEFNRVASLQWESLFGEVALISETRSRLSTQSVHSCQHPLEKSVARHLQTVEERLRPRRSAHSRRNNQFPKDSLAYDETTRLNSITPRLCGEKRDSPTLLIHSSTPRRLIG